MNTIWDFTSLHRLTVKSNKSIPNRAYSNLVTTSFHAWRNMKKQRWRSSHQRENDMRLLNRNCLLKLLELTGDQKACLDQLLTKDKWVMQVILLPLMSSKQVIQLTLEQKDTFLFNNSSTAKVKRIPWFMPNSRVLWLKLIIQPLEDKEFADLTEKKLLLTWLILLMWLMMTQKL